MNAQTIAVRAYTIPQDSKPPSDYTAKVPFFDRTITWDTETTTDYLQNLKFGYFKVHQNNVLEYQGLFYDKKSITSKELEILLQYSETHSVKLYTIEEFRDIFVREVFDNEALCIGFNLPFDISRIALHVGTSRKNKKDCFSFIVSEKPWYPRLLVTHISNTMSFINWGNNNLSSKRFGGYFLDLRTLTYALTDKKHTLESACKYFKTAYQKQKVTTHGKITKTYIDYCINDVDATFSLYKNARKEFDSYQVDIPVTKAYTPASIGKAILKKIGIKPFFAKNPKFSKDMLGYMMNCYFGGRTEDRIRLEPTLVDVLDFLSMYPTVCTLQNLWKFVIANKIEPVEATSEITNLIDSITLEDIQKKETWSKLHAIVLLEPQKDILPIRSKFSDNFEWNIGICSVTSKELLWYSLADVISSKLKTGNTPKIHLAYKFVPIGIQQGLCSIEFFGTRIDPIKDDLFKKLIEYRKLLQKAGDPREKIIKIIANAISYGIFVEIQQEDEKEPIPVQVYGREHFVESKTKSEKVGYMFNPIIAVSITSASRLLLSVTEILLEKKNSTHAYCDTDSMFVPPQHTKMIQDFFQPLNPYDFDAPIFKIERENILFFGISSKRYCLYHIENGKFDICDDDYSAHGLGYLLDPSKEDADDNSDWLRELWIDILQYHYNDVDLVSKYANKFAIQKIGISRPSLWNRFSKFNQGKPYFEQIKPFNFALVGFGIIADKNTCESIKPLTSYQYPAKHAVYDDFIDCNAKTGETLRGTKYWMTLHKTIEDYIRHSESKLDGDIGILKTREVFVSNVIHIGKESNTLEDLGLNSESYVIYENHSAIEKKFQDLVPKILELTPKDVKPFGISKQTLWNVKNKIKIKQYHRISYKLKICMMNQENNVNK